MKYLCSKNCHTQVVSKASCLEKLSHSNSDRKNTCIAMSAMFNLLKHTHTHTHTHNHFTALWILSGTTQVSWYQKKHSPTHTYHGHQLSPIRFLHPTRSMASSLFNPHAWQSFLQSLSKFSLGLAPSTSYFIHFFTQSLTSFRNTCQYHHSPFCCSTKIMSSNPSLSLSLSTFYLEFYLVASRHTSV